MKYPCLYVTYWCTTGYPAYTEIDGQPIEYQLTIEDAYHDRRVEQKAVFDDKSASWKVLKWDNETESYKYDNLEKGELVIAWAYNHFAYMDDLTEYRPSFKEQDRRLLLNFLQMSKGWIYSIGNYFLEREETDK